METYSVRKYIQMPVIIFMMGSIVFGCNNAGGLRNVVVILADDHARNVSGLYGNEIIRTPNIDRLASEGITFSNAYCNAPICSASRQSLLTGKYPHATGVNLLFTPFPDEKNTTIAEHLKKFNYKTAIIGKTHWNNWLWNSIYANGLPHHGFDVIIEDVAYRDFLKDNPQPALPADLEYYSKESLTNGVAEWMNSRVLPHPVDDAHSLGTFFSKEAIRFMENNKSEPFFLWLAYKEPHHPYYFPIEYSGKYSPAEMTLPVGSPEDDRWIPEKFRNLTEDEKRGIIAAYYTSTEYMDKNIGLVLDALENLGLEENTLVIYISDNGYLLYDHKRFEKHTMWEESVHQPIIVRAGSASKIGVSSDAIVEYVDIVPTIMDLLHKPTLSEAQGVSFAAVIQNQAKTHKDYAFSEYLEDNMAMVCDREWKYVFATGCRDLGIGYKTGYGPSGIVHRLYNLQVDTKESRNLAADPAHREILQKFQQIMLEHFLKTHPDAANCPNGLTLEGKLVWFCEPRDIGADQSAEDKPIPVRPFTE